MNGLWRNRRKLGAWLQEIGCGLLTVLLFTLPVWVLTISWRGPGFALASLFVIALVLGIVVAISRLVKRR